ncbi:MAG TPA: Mur ligase domain-containing protein, partial [Parachlamydiaceae bacterium]|nr:Mur ligase domain-containing protein [Parachlamydiaceae bacterium]
MDAFDLRLWEGFVQAGGNAALPAITDQITIDSRRIDSKNALFVALEGKTFDGHRFISHAIEAGARFILAKKNWIPQECLGNITLLKVDDPVGA